MDLAKPAIRSAGTLILIRDPGGAPRVLLGRRPDAAAFLPGTYVFPGGAVDDADIRAVPDRDLPAKCALALGGTGPAVAAIRELREETGLTLGEGLDLSALAYVFRAVTPPGYPRRFDAHFFVADARHINGDPDILTPEEPELLDLRWVGLAELAKMRLPSITRHVLTQVTGRLPSLDPPDVVPELGI